MTSRRSRRDKADASTKPAGGRSLMSSRRQAARNPEAVLQAAVDAINSGDFETGLKLAEQLLRVGGHRVAAEVAAHAALHLEPGAAIKALARLCKAQRNDPALLNDLGGVLCQAKRFEEAESRFRQSLKLRPRHPSTLANLGQALLGQKKYEDAAAAFRDAVEIDPSFAPGHSGLAAALEALDRFDDAVKAHHRALEIEPDNRMYVGNLEKAYLLAGTGHEVRERLYRDLLRRNPNEAGVLFGLGGVLHDMQRFDDAAAIYVRLMDMDVSERHYAKSRFAMGELYFIQGDYERAWEYLDWRLKFGDVDVRPHPFPAWQGEDIAGKTILVWEEQGVGERCMFGRFLPLLLARGAKVVYEAVERLAPAIQRTFPEIEVIVAEDPPLTVGRTDIDYQIPMGSLGRWLWHDFVEAPLPPTLVAKPGEASAFRQRYLAAAGADPTALLVGVAWRSRGPKLGPTKSMRLAELAPILTRPNTVVVDLQYGNTEDDRALVKDQLGIEIVHDDTFDQLGDFDRFLSQLAALDAVVSISNTTLHAAGALGVPTAGLLSTVPMWRWGLEGERSIWYPSVRLFRQARPGDWSAPIGQAAAFVDSIADSRNRGGAPA